MRQEIIRVEDGIEWTKFHLSPRERLGRFLRLIPDLLLPRFWDGEKDTYGLLTDRLSSVVDNLREGLFGYWIGCQPTEFQ